MDRHEELATGAIPLGRVFVTAGARSVLSSHEVIRALIRHAHRDWGDLDDEDKASNDRAIQDDSRLLSAYHGRDGRKFWIITEADRSATTVLLPEDY